MHTKKYIDNLFKNAIYGNHFIQLTAEDVQNCKLSLIKNKHNTPKEDCNKLKENDNTYYKDFKTSLDDKTLRDLTMTKADKTYNKNNSSIVDEPAKKKQKVDKNRIDVLKLVICRVGKTEKFKSQFKSPLKTNKEIDTTSTEEVSMEESIESEKSSEKNVKSMIRIIDPKKMMDEDAYKMWMKNYPFCILSKHLRTNIKKLSVAKLSTTRSQPSLHSNNTLNAENLVRGNLIKIEKLYKKYFIKSVRDTIVIIANILNIILMSEKYYKARFDASFKKKNEFQKLKERCDAHRLHVRHKKILETKLKNNFKDVISSFEESEFDLAFQMFLLSILTVLRVLDQPNFKKGNIFKKLVLLLIHSLKNSDYNHPQMFSLLGAKTLERNCITLISLIEDSRDIDSGVTDRMSLFFVSVKNNRKYFQAVIDAVTSDSKEDLALLIDNATLQFSNNSMFKDPVNSTTVTETNQSTNNSYDMIQYWILAKIPDGTYQHKPVLNGSTSQTTGNTAVKPLNVMSQPLNTFCQSFSSQLQKKTYVSSTSQVIPTNKCFGVMPINSHSPLVQATTSLLETAISIPTPTTSVALQSSMQNKISMENSSVHRVEGSTIVLGNKHHQLVKGPTDQMKEVVNGYNPKPESPVLNNIVVNQKPTVFIKCHARNCNNSASLLCRNIAMKYCSNNCQVIDRYDLYDWIVI